MDIQKDEQTKLELSPQIVTMMTTEHYNLQTGRAMTISDANGRANLFLGTVSSTLVALAFVGQISRLGTAFFVFSLVLFPSLIFLGLVTFERVLQSGIEDTIYGRGINRIRHLYLEYAPQMKPYFIMSSSDDNTAVMGNMGVHGSWWQLFLSIAGMIAVLNSVIVGAFFGLFLYALFSLSLPICVIVSIISFLISVVWHQLYQQTQWQNMVQHLDVRFPSNQENRAQ